MKENYTHITVILDRSGSMDSIRDDTIGGFNTFLAQQQAEPGTATLTLVQFDSQDPYEMIHHFRLLSGVPALTRETFVPRGGTPLLDAMGRGIIDLETNIKAISEAERPSKVIFAVITDGQENASREFKRDRVQQMIAEKTKDDWQFVFLSADLSAIGESHDLGIAPSSSLLFSKDSIGTENAWRSFSDSASAYRAREKASMTFEEKDRQHPDDPAAKGGRKAKK